MCDSCSRAAANPDQWIAKVQLRQKVDHKRTFFFLEQLILKHGADANTINIKQVRTQGRATVFVFPGCLQQVALNVSLNALLHVLGLCDQLRRSFSVRISIAVSQGIKK